MEYYVSRLGDNSDGTSWATAWNELDQIAWSVIQAGDTILVDGGAVACPCPVMVTNESNNPGDCGMVYETTLTIGKSGEPGNPITIKLAEEPDRNGTVLIFGGNSTPIPACGSTSSRQDGRASGIYVNGKSYVTVDGVKWGGIKVYGHYADGIDAEDGYANTHHLIFKNIEVFDNGSSGHHAGVRIGGSDHLFERVMVHDNDQDQFQTCHVATFNNITIRRSWLFNARPHPDDPIDVANGCRHSDGLQYCSEPISYNLLIEECIVGPGLMQGLLPGSHRNPCLDVTVRNTLIVSHHGASSNEHGHGILTGVSALPPSGYVLDHVTVYRDAGAKWHNICLHGGGHQITNCIFHGGGIITLEEAPAIAANNFCWQLDDPYGIATEMDPMFADDVFAGVGDGFADFDFTVQNPAIPPGTGSPITTVAQLFASGGVSMARNVNTWLTNWQATGQSPATPQYTVDLTIEWVDDVGQPQSWSRTVTFPNDLADVPMAWLKKELLDLMYRCARKKLGID